MQIISSKALLPVHRFVKKKNLCGRKIIFQPRVVQFIQFIRKRLTKKQMIFLEN